MEKLASIAAEHELGAGHGSGEITAGNSSQMTDGAVRAAMLVAERSLAERLGLPESAATAALRRRRQRQRPWFLSAPVPVTHKLLERSGMSIDDFDSDRMQRGLRGDRTSCGHHTHCPPGSESKYNPFGGAIAIGHPLRGRAGSGSPRPC